MPEPSEIRSWRILVLGACAVLGWGAAGALRTRPAPKRVPPAAEPPLVVLDTATYEQLLGIPGMTPRLARAILAHREANGPFRRLEDLDGVPGIGPKTVRRLKPYLQGFAESAEEKQGSGVRGEGSERPLTPQPSSLSPEYNGR